MNRRVPFPRPARSAAVARRRVVAALPGLAALWMAPRSSGAASDLDALFEQLGGGDEKVGNVEILAWVEQGAEGSELVIRLEPWGDAKLVADPGIEVEGLPENGIEWPKGATARAVLPGTSYFETVPELRMPFRARGAGPVRVRIDYAYCLVGYQCLFGKKELAVELPQS